MPGSEPRFGGTFDVDDASGLEPSLGEMFENDPAQESELHFGRLFKDVEVWASDGDSKSFVCSSSGQMSSRRSGVWSR